MYSARNMNFKDLPDQGKEARRLIKRLEQSDDAEQKMSQMKKEYAIMN